MEYGKKSPTSYFLLHTPYFRRIWQGMVDFSGDWLARVQFGLC